MLWQKLQREPPNSLAEMIRIADVYAMGDPMQPMLDSAEPGQGNHYGSGFRRNDHNNFRNKRREPDYRYGANQVNAVEQNQPGPGNSQRQKTNGPAWGAKERWKEAVGRPEEAMAGEVHIRVYARSALQVSHVSSE